MKKLWKHFEFHLISKRKVEIKNICNFFFDFGLCSYSQFDCDASTRKEGNIHSSGLSLYGILIFLFPFC
jgi:hypothetical protein